MALQQQALLHTVWVKTMAQWDTPSWARYVISSLQEFYGSKRSVISDIFLSYGIIWSWKTTLKYEEKKTWDCHAQLSNKDLMVTSAKCLTLDFCSYWDIGMH